MNADELRARVASFPYWYHRIELPDGIVTPGFSPIDASKYGIPADLEGLRVLDVGAWDGSWTFQALKRGAREVVAIDDFSDYLGLLKKEARSAWQTFDLCRDAFGYPEERCKRIEMSVYDVSPSRLGTFDIVFFFGTLYHLRHPLLALDRLAEVCSGQVFVESAILDDYSPYKGGFGPHYAAGDVVMEFYPRDEYSQNVTNWWCPTLACLMRMVYAAGFNRDLQGWKLMDRPTQLSMARGYVSGRK